MKKFMKYGIDNHGEKIFYKEALITEKYLCPHCTESLILKAGKKSYFAHNIIKGRTPLQRMCPEYHGNDRYKNNDIDKTYIENGGIPLYLCNDGNIFEFRAYFPEINQFYKDDLIKKNTEVIINNKRWCSVETLNYYVVSNIQNWIEVKLNPETTFKEVKRKWLWGIRGINIEKDIYHSNKEGGYRVAIKANIYIGKSYRILFKKKEISYIKGITFTKIGEIKLKEFEVNCIYYIFEMKIKEYTEEARQFIESKGYSLKEKADDVIPVWPPVIFKGNELLSDSDNIWFYHSNKNNNEMIYEINNEEENIITKKDIFKINNISKSNEKIIVMKSNLSSKNLNNVSSEIKYIIYNKSLNNEKYMEPKVTISDSLGNIIDLKKEKLPIKKELFIKANVLTTAILTRDSYCIYTSKNFLEEINHTKKIIIDCGGFGVYKFEVNNKFDNKEKFQWDSFYYELYNSKGAFIKPQRNCKIVLYKIRKNINKENIKVYLILYNWIIKQKIPIEAQKVINRNEVKILND